MHAAGGRRLLRTERKHMQTNAPTSGKPTDMKRQFKLEFVNNIE